LLGAVTLPAATEAILAAAGGVWAVRVLRRCHLPAYVRQRNFDSLALFLFHVLLQEELRHVIVVWRHGPLFNFLVPIFQQFYFLPAHIFDIILYVEILCNMVQYRV